jgi:hypothetical protein
MKIILEMKEQRCFHKPIGYIKTLQRADGCAVKSLQQNLLGH